MIRLTHTCDLLHYRCMWDFLHAHQSYYTAAAFYVRKYEGMLFYGGGFKMETRNQNEYKLKGHIILQNKHEMPSKKTITFNIDK